MNHTLREHRTLAAAVSQRRAAPDRDSEPVMAVGAILRAAVLGLLCWAVIIGLVAGGAVVGRWIVAAFGAAVGG